MNQSPCELLDDYLNHDLAVSVQNAFQRHLASCPECREVVNELQAVTSFQATALEQEPVPNTLMLKVDRARRQRRRRQAGWAVGIAAGMVIALLSWWGLSDDNVPSPQPQEPPIVREDLSPKPKDEEVTAPIQVVVEPSSRIIAVPVKSDDPNITVIWTYQTLPTKQSELPEETLSRKE